MAIKHVYGDIYGIPASHQLLRYAGKTMYNHDTLAAHGIVKASVLHLSIAVLDGVRTPGAGDDHAECSKSTPVMNVDSDGDCEPKNTGRRNRKRNRPICGNRLRIQITIKGVEGKMTSLSVCLTDRIVDIKQLICDNNGISIGEQKLLFGGVCLHDDQTLQDRGIAHGSLIELQLRMLGGTTYPCTFCTETFSSIQSLREHVQQQYAEATQPWSPTSDAILSGTFPLAQKPRDDFHDLNVESEDTELPTEHANLQPECATEDTCLRRSSTQNRKKPRTLAQVAPLGISLISLQF